MEFTITRTNLLTLIEAATAVTEKKNTIPILASVRLEAKEKTLQITGTDLDTTFKGQIECDVTTEGALCVNAKKLLDITKSFPNGDIGFKVAEHQATIKSGSTRFKLLGTDRSTFPDVDHQTEKILTIPAKLLREGLARTIPSTTNDESRYALHGVLFKLENNKIVIVGTDGHRMAYFEAPVEYNDSTFSRIIPKKAAAEITKLAENTETLTISSDANHIHFSNEKCSITTRLVTGQFPAYEMVLLHQPKNKFTVKRTELLRASQQANILADERSHCVKITIKPGLSGISSQASDQGESEINFETTYTGEEIISGFNATYLLNYLSTETTETVEIQVKESNTQWQFVPVGDLPYNYKYTIMPMRI